MLELKNRLHSWVKRKEKSLEAPQMLAHILDSSRTWTPPTFQNPPLYSRAKLRYIGSIAEELGLVLAIGQLVIRQTGDMLSDRDRSPECGRWRCDGDCEQCVDIGPRYEMDYSSPMKTTCKLEGMSRPDLNRLELDPACLLPQFDISAEDHDEKESDSHRVTHVYYRPILTLWPKSEEISVLLTTVPDSAIISFVEKETARLSALPDPPATGVLPSPLLTSIEQSEHTLRRPGCAAAIIQAAIISRNFALCDKVMTLTDQWKEIQADVWAKALRVFGFSKLEK